MSETSIILSGTDPDLPKTAPRELTRYTGMREMARGGSAILRACYDTVTGRTVAIKILPFETRWDRNERRRFLREARITAQLQHPNTVPVYDIGEDPKEGLFFVMKRISGENLFEILKRIARGDEATIEAYPISRRLEIAEGAMQALAYAHARGVIHRDVKPENIWVGNFGEVILLDWGVAKVWGHNDDMAAPQKHVGTTVADDEQKPLTDQGQRPGTPLYMSPEQIDNSRGIDERTDIFSAGVTIYEILTIREAFRGRDIHETFSNIKNKQIPPPSERSPERNIPQQLDAIVMQALEKRPEKRYQSMREFISALREFDED